MNKALLATAMAAALSGCAMLEPRSTEVAPAIPAQWPATTSTAAAVEVADIGWRDYFVDERLQSLIAQSLDNNRDLRVAILNVDKARAQYRIQRADRVPALGVQGQMTRSGGDVPVTEQFSANWAWSSSSWTCSAACATSAVRRCSSTSPRRPTVATRSCRWWPK